MSEAAHSSTYMTRSSEEVMHPSGWALFPTKSASENTSTTSSHVVTYAHYACVADRADAMADAWEDTAGCAQAICLHENLLK